MPRSRVLSFMSQWGVPSSRPESPRSPRSPTFSPADRNRESNTFSSPRPRTPTGQNTTYDRPPQTGSPVRRERAASRTAGSRPASMVQTYQPPVMEVAGDTLPELQPIFTFLNSHSNKLYQEGYFLKLHDLDTRGRPSADRTWTECFAQLVGTVLSLWDAAQLDIAGEDGEVVPSFINLADASIKMIESLPMNSRDGQTLNNVLSISTAANNRYLFHFNSLNSLTQWTAGIRLAMYEHATLQEAYTGSLIAGKGKGLNNIRTIMERTRIAQADWARVRFGAGTPWRRCWCVISPPDEKEYQKHQKTLKKQQNIYNRSAPVLKGTMKFYESKKITKKTRPIATITDAYSAYAIYPQSKPLIDQSTLVKLECSITIHSSPESTTEGFVFVMPEVHPAVSGLEMMLRFLFPVWDVFNLYGRPTKLVADVLDTRGLMFAMPKDRRYGYLELLDVATLIHSDGSQDWNERRWRQELKNLTSVRMSAAMERGSGPSSRTTSRRATASQTNLPIIRGVRFGGDNTPHSQPTTRHNSPNPIAQADRRTKRVDSAPPGTFVATHLGHQRSISETSFRRSHDGIGPRREIYGDSGFHPTTPTRINHGYGHKDDAFVNNSANDPYVSDNSSDRATPEHETDQKHVIMQEVQALASPLPPPAPVQAPPTMHHAPSSKPPAGDKALLQMPELRRAHSAIDQATIEELAEANQSQTTGALAVAGAAAAWKKTPNDRSTRNGSGHGSRPGTAGDDGRYDTRGRPGSAGGYSQEQQYASVQQNPYEQGQPQYGQSQYSGQQQPQPHHRQPFETYGSYPQEYQQTYHQPIYQQQQYAPYIQQQPYTQPIAQNPADRPRSRSANRSQPNLQVNSRLPTIPASPYVDQQSANSPHPNYFVPAHSSVPEHGDYSEDTTPASSFPSEQPPQDTHLNGHAQNTPQTFASQSVELPYRPLEAQRSDYTEDQPSPSLGIATNRVNSTPSPANVAALAKPGLPREGSSNSITRKPVGSGVASAGGK